MSAQLINSGYLNQDISPLIPNMPTGIPEQKIKSPKKREREDQDENRGVVINALFGKKIPLAVSDIQKAPKEVPTVFTIQKAPFLQCVEDVFSSSDDDSVALSPFSDWTDQERLDAVNQLERMKIPLGRSCLLKIYQVLKNFQKHLCENRRVSYPARYHVSSTTLENSSIAFDLEIYHNKKANLIFPTIQANHIQSGTSKRVYRVFALGSPRIRAYGEVFPPSSVDKIEVFHEIGAREQEGLIKFQDKEWIAKIYRIFYQHVIVNGQEFNRQVIEMKCYQGDLFDLMTQTQLSNQTKLSYSIQLMQALADIHDEQLIHRDIKPENILVDGEKIGLTDFGTMCKENDRRLKMIPVGTKGYLAPELMIRRSEQLECVAEREVLSEEKIGVSLDIWAAGCTLWLLWGEGHVYPWYEDAITQSPNYSVVLDKIKRFDRAHIDPKNKMMFIIWNMLRYDSQQRWSAREVLEQLKGGKMDA